jgi:hypothetical protein
VIDDDPGVSAATADPGKGFARLVTEVTLGRVGRGAGHRDVPAGTDRPALVAAAGAVLAVRMLLAHPDGAYDSQFYKDRPGLTSESDDKRTNTKSNTAHAAMTPPVMLGARNVI